MVDIASPLLDGERAKRRADRQKRARRWWMFTIAAFELRGRDYISRRLYAILTAILFASLLLVVVFAALAFGLPIRAFATRDHGLSGAGVAAAVVCAVLVAWIAVRQLSLAAARFRAAGRSPDDWHSKNWRLWMYVGLAIPVMTVEALFLNDSAEYRYRTERLRRDREAR